MKNLIKLTHDHYMEMEYHDHLGEQASAGHFLYVVNKKAQCDNFIRQVR